MYRLGDCVDLCDLKFSTNRTFRGVGPKAFHSQPLLGGFVPFLCVAAAHSTRNTPACELYMPASWKPLLATGGFGADFTQDMRSGAGGLE